MKTVVDTKSSFSTNIQTLFSKATSREQNLCVRKHIVCLIGLIKLRNYIQHVAKLYETSININ